MKCFCLIFLLLLTRPALGVDCSADSTDPGCSPVNSSTQQFDLNKAAQAFEKSAGVAHGSLYAMLANILVIFTVVWAVWVLIGYLKRQHERKENDTVEAVADLWRTMAGAAIVLMFVLLIAWP